MPPPRGLTLFPYTTLFRSMRIFASDWVQKAMKLIGMKEDDVIEDRLVSRQIEKAQRKVEAHNFDIRKNLLDFDDVNNDQRKDRKSTRLNSSHMSISYAVFC